MKAFPSGLKVSDIKSAVLWTGVSLPIVLVISGCFQDFSFVFSSRSLNRMHLRLGYFGFTLFSIHWASWICRFVFWQIWEGFSHYFIEYFFSSTLSTLSFWPKIQMWSITWVSHAVTVGWPWGWGHLKGHFTESLAPGLGAGSRGSLAAAPSPLLFLLLLPWPPPCRGTWTQLAPEASLSEGPMTAA